MDKDDVKAIVADVLNSRLGRTRPSAGDAVRPSGDDEVRTGPRDLVCERDVMEARRAGVLVVTPGTLVTPLARETAERYGVAFREQEPRPPVEEVAAAAHAVDDAAAPVVALGCDHGGVVMKDLIRGHLEKEGRWRVLDVGTHGPEPVDYPDFAHKVAGLVSRGEAWRGIVVDGVGVGSCMAANRHRGVRAAAVRSILEATNAREHNDANVLCLGGRMIGDLVATALVNVFLATPFGGGRHARRVAKIEEPG